MGVYRLEENSERVIRMDAKSLEHGLAFQEQHLWGTDQKVIIGQGHPTNGPRVWADIAVEQLSSNGAFLIPRTESLSRKQTYAILALELGVPSADRVDVMEAMMKRSESKLRESQKQPHATATEVLGRYFINHAKWLHEQGYLEPYLGRSVNMNDPWDRLKASHELKESKRDYLDSPTDDQEFLRQLTHSLSVDLFANMGLDYLPYTVLQKENARRKGH